MFGHFLFARPPRTPARSLSRPVTAHTPGELRSGDEAFVEGVILGSKITFG